MDCKLSKNLVLDIITQRGEIPLFIMPIGPSAAGKTMFADKFIDGGFTVFSWDVLRNEWYPKGASSGWVLSRDDKTFIPRANQEFIKLIKTKKDIVYDNTNLSAKRRTFSLTEAKRHGYKTIGVLFPCSVYELMERQIGRPDKAVPEGAIEIQYNALTIPSFGEFDDIVMAIDNIKV